MAVNRGIAAAGGRITAEGELDFRGTLGVDREAPVGFRAIRLNFELDPQLSGENLDTLLSLTERYCVVYQTIRRGVPVTISSSSLPVGSTRGRRHPPSGNRLSCENESVIPTMLLVGLVVGRFWAIPLGAVAWGVLLVATGVAGIGDVPFGLLLGAANVAVGVLAHRLIAWPLGRRFAPS